MPKVTAIVLCGGQGTRLQSVIGGSQKCIAKVNGRPFLSYILDQLISVKNIGQIVLAVGYEANSVFGEFGREYQKYPLDYSADEIENGGNGAAIKSALPLVKNNDEILILNGDTYIDCDFADFIYDSRLSRAKTSVLINVWKGIVPMGVYYTDLWVLDDCIPEDKSYHLEQSFLNEAHYNGVRAEIICRPFIDIGTPEAFAKAGEFMQSILMR